MAEEENVDEAVTAETKSSNDMEIYSKEEQKTQAYKKKTNIDIKTINKFDKRNKLCTTQLRTIYKVT